MRSRCSSAIAHRSAMLRRGHSAAALPGEVARAVGSIERTSCTLTTSTPCSARGRCEPRERRSHVVLPVHTTARCRRSPTSPARPRLHALPRRKTCPGVRFAAVETCPRLSPTGRARAPSGGADSSTAASCRASFNVALPSPRGWRATARATVLPISCRTRVLGRAARGRRATRSTSRLVPDNGLETAIDAAEEPRCRCAIAGSGPEEAALRTLAGS